MFADLEFVYPLIGKKPAVATPFAPDRRAFELLEIALVANSIARSARARQEIKTRLVPGFYFAFVRRSHSPSSAILHRP